MMNENNSKISNILMIRRNILESLRDIEHSKDMDISTLERIADYFFRYDDFLIPILIEEFQKNKEERVLSKYEFILKYLDNPNLIKPLIDCLEKNKDNLKLKRTIFRVLKHYNVEFSAPPLNQYYQELLRDSEKLSEKLINTYNCDWYNFNSALSEFFYVEDGQIEVLKFLEKNEDLRKYGVLLTLLLSNNPYLIEEIIKILGRSYDGQAYDVLRKALIFLPAKYHKQIDLNLRKLSFKGVKNSDFIESGEILSCYISYPLVDDERYILYDISKDNQYIVALIEIDREIGIGENGIFYITKNKEAKEKKINDFIENLNLKKVTNGYDIRLINNAVFNNYVVDATFPPVFSILINFLPVYYFKPLKYSPDRVLDKFSSFNIKKEVLLKNSAKLWDIVYKLGWLSEDYRFIKIVEKWYLNAKKEEYFWMDDLLVRKVLREIILSDINNWKNKLLFLADFLDNINESREYIEMILSVYDAFTRDIEKMEKMPFIRKLILESKNLVLIFTSGGSV